MSARNYYSHDPDRLVQSVAAAVSILRTDGDRSDMTQSDALSVIGTDGQPIWLGPGFQLPYFPEKPIPGRLSRHRYLAERPFTVASSQSDGDGVAVGTPDTARLQGRVRLSTRLPHWDAETSARTNSHNDIAAELSRRGIFIPAMSELKLRSETLNTVTVYQLFNGSLAHRLLSPDTYTGPIDMWTVRQVDEDGQPPIIRDGSGLPLWDFARDARPAAFGSFHRAQPLPEYALIATKYQCFLGLVNVGLWYDGVKTLEEDEATA